MAHDAAKIIARRLVEDLWTKIKETVDDILEPEEDKPKPPPKVQHASPSSNHAAAQNPLPTFGNLNLSDNWAPTQQLSDSPFIGGFNPVLSAPAPNLPRPAVLPFINEYPQQVSTTMQMALRPPEEANSPRPHANLIPSTLPTSGSSPPRPSMTGKPASHPSTPIKVTKSESESISATVTPTKKPDPEQCSGIAKAEQQCTRKVKARPALSSVDSDDSKIPLKFCHQHSKELMTQTGYYSRKNREWVKFEDWIPHYLHPNIQVSLRAEMERARSQSDVPGYIYTFEIRDTEEMDTIKLKVGRAVNLVKRIDQWGKQCGSKEQVLRGFYPGGVEPDEVSLMKGRVIAGEQGPWCHKLERLIHLELGDLVSYIYLDPKWPNVEIKGPTPESPAKAKDSKTRKPCVDCGSMHKEIFEFKRWKQGNNREWDDLVKPVIERWGKFVELHVK